MLKNISFGIYYPANSILHRLQARTKLLVLIWFAVFIYIANKNIWHFVPYIVLAMLIVLGTALARVSVGQMWQRMRLLVFFAIFGAIFAPFSHDSGSLPIYTIGPFAISFAQVHWAIVIYGVLLTIYIILSLLPMPALRNFLQNRRLKGIRILLIPLTLAVIALLWFTRNIPLTNIFPLGPFVITDTGTWSLLTRGRWSASPRPRRSRFSRWHSRSVHEPYRRVTGSPPSIRSVRPTRKPWRARAMASAGRCGS